MLLIAKRNYGIKKNTLADLTTSASYQITPYNPYYLVGFFLCITKRKKGVLKRNTYV